MEWVKLHTRYYLDGAVLRAGEEAEVLFTRGLAYAGDQETDGFIATEALALLVSKRARARAAALVRVGLWETVDGGWRIPKWVKHQVTAEKLEQKREAGRTRVARHRERTRNAVTNGVTNGVLRSGEVEEEVEAAAAASTPPLPPSLEILKTRLDAAKLVARWDRLAANPDQVALVEQLIEVHGDGPLVKSALMTHRPDSPAAFAQAWLGAWSSLPAPGTGLRAVTSPPCPVSGHSGTTSHCVQCASERLEEGTR